MLVYTVSSSEDRKLHRESPESKPVCVSSPQDLHPGHIAAVSRVCLPGNGCPFCHLYILINCTRRLFSREWKNQISRLGACLGVGETAGYLCRRCCIFEVVLSHNPQDCIKEMNYCWILGLKVCYLFHFYFFPMLEKPCTY